MNEQEAFDWAKKNRKTLRDQFFGKKALTPSSEKIAVFMAGSPGAGKTEFISRLITKDQESSYYTLDLDEIRTWIPGYKGRNAEKYTRGAIKILEMLIDECQDKGYNFILDGTFTSTSVIDRNINRLLTKGYLVSVFYIHTQPYVAWYYTLFRECEDGRHVPVERFIRDYSLARENVLLKKMEYGDRIKVYVADKRRLENGGKLISNVYSAETYQELEEILDKKAPLYYNVGKSGDKAFFLLTYFLSRAPFGIGKKLLRLLGQSAEIPTKPQKK